MGESIKFTRNNIIAIVLVVALIIATILLNLDITLVGFLVASTALLLNWSQLKENTKTRENK